MSIDAKHICVCVCTYKRPEMLRLLLSKLVEQETDRLFSHSIVIVDNDVSESARHVVESHALESAVSIRYYVEPEQNIALARNKATANARGDFIAFMDDDEFPQRDWLACLYRTCNKFDADGVLGPVLPYFNVAPPRWVLQGKYFDRPTHKTGTVLPWYNTRTGNVLFDASILQGDREPFNREFGSGGEDRHFFRRMIGQGRKFVWCNEAPVYEVIPPERWKKSFMLRRALLRGTNPSFTKLSVAKSLFAIPVYTLSLPFLWLFGPHVFMKYLLKDCDHLGRVLSFLGFRVIKDKYVTTS